MSLRHSWCSNTTHTTRSQSCFDFNRCHFASPQGEVVTHTPLTLRRRARVKLQANTDRRAREYVDIVARSHGDVMLVQNPVTLTSTHAVSRARHPSSWDSEPRYHDATPFIHCVTPQQLQQNSAQRNVPFVQAPSQRARWSTTLCLSLSQRRNGCS